MRPLCLMIGVMLTALLSGATASQVRAEGPLVFVSSFAAGDEGAISSYRVDPATGKLTLVKRNAGAEHPFFLALSPDRKFLYSIHGKTFSGKDNEEVAAYKVAGGELTLLNRQSSRGTASCYLAVDATDKTVLVANYTTGSVGALPIQADGSLGAMTSFVQHAGTSVDPARQTGPHAHCFVISPNNKFAYSADLGLDKILCYQLDPAAAKLTPAKQPFARTLPGAGPRHLTFHPNGKHLYVINEMANSVTLFDHDAETGGLIERQTISTVPNDFKGTSHCADLKITPNGKFLYGTNRGHDSLAMYSIAADGQLTLIGIEPSLGKGPQNLLILPGGDFLLCANMPGNNLAVFRIDPVSGKLKSAGEPIAVHSPSCLMLVP